MIMVPAALFLDRKPPTQKGVEYRFKIIISKRREEEKMTEGSSGIVGGYGKNETLLDLILEIDEHSEQECEERGKRLEREEKLKEAEREDPKYGLEAMQ